MSIVAVPRSIAAMGSVPPKVEDGKLPDGSAVDPAKMDGVKKLPIGPVDSVRGADLTWVDDKPLGFSVVNQLDVAFAGPVDDAGTIGRARKAYRFGPLEFFSKVVDVPVNSASVDALTKLQTAIADSGIAKQDPIDTLEKRDATGSFDFEIVGKHQMNEIELPMAEAAPNVQAVADAARGVFRDLFKAAKLGPELSVPLKKAPVDEAKAAATDDSKAAPTDDSNAAPTESTRQPENPAG